MDFIKKEIERLRRASGASSYFLLEDGTKYTYDPRKVLSQLQFHSTLCCRADYKRRKRTPLPEHYHKLAQAQDRIAAIRQLYPDVQLPLRENDPGPFVAVDLNTLVTEGRLEHRWMAPSYEPITA